MALLYVTVNGKPEVEKSTQPKFVCSAGLQCIGMCLQEKGRLRKWRHMVGAGGLDWQDYLNKHPAKVKRRIRKGIPDALRGLVWQLLSGTDACH